MTQYLHQNTYFTILTDWIWWLSEKYILIYFIIEIIQFLESLPAVPLNPLSPASSPAGPSSPAEAGRESPSLASSTCDCWEFQPLYNLQQPNKQQPGSSPPISVCEAQKFEAGDPAQETDQQAILGAEVLNHMLGHKSF